VGIVLGLELAKITKCFGDILIAQEFGEIDRHRMGPPLARVGLLLTG
jgi:hypothetical protein